MIATVLAPRLAEAPVATLLGPAPLPTFFELRWAGGRASGPFLSYEQAAEYALELPALLASDEYHVDDDGRVYTLDADEDGPSKHYVGAIVEVGA